MKIETLQAITQIFTVSSIGTLGVRILLENAKVNQRSYKRGNKCGCNAKTTNSIHNVYDISNNNQCVEYQRDHKEYKRDKEKQKRSCFIDLTPYNVKEVK